MHNTQHSLQQLNQCRQTAQQLIQQTQQKQQPISSNASSGAAKHSNAATDSKPRTTSCTYHSASAARTRHGHSKVPAGCQHVQPNATRNHWTIKRDEYECVYTSIRPKHTIPVAYLSAVAYKKLNTMFSVELFSYRSLRICIS